MCASDALTSRRKSRDDGRMKRLVLLLLLVATPARAETFEPGTLIVPMDLSYQSTGMFQAYGLLYQLLRQDIDVRWVIDPAKTWHAAACNTPGNLCTWDCGVEGSGTK